MITALEAACGEISARRGVRIAKHFINRDAPAACDPRIVDTVAGVCASEGISLDRMVSRAYHDTLFMARLCPASMIFIPCRNGYSHRPDEYSSPEAIALGVRVLAGTLAKLAA
jgi:N-carbamoyl-L-amino-acid hydrolase